MAQTQGYPTTTTVKTDLTAQKIETMVKGDTLFQDMFNNLMWQLLKQTERSRVGSVNIFDITGDSFEVLGGQYEFEGTTKTLVDSGEIIPTANDITFVWIKADNTIGTAIDGTGWPTTEHYIPLATITVDATPLITAITDVRPMLRKSQGIIPIALTSLREVVTNDITTLAAHGGILAKDSTPKLEFINGDIDSCLRLNWAASNNDPIIFQTTLPNDFDAGVDLVIKMRLASSGTTNAVGFDLDTYFDEGDTKIEDTSETNQTTTYAEKKATIAAADIPTSPRIITCELTPVAHTTDAMYLTALWLEYNKK